MNAYELKQALRKSRQADRAEDLAAAADALFKAAHASIAMIPPGQPILVGHHSERRHRRDLARHDRLMRRAIDTQNRAESLRGRAATVSSAISADDPDAPDKLAERIAELERKQAQMTAINKLIRKNDRAGLAAMGLSAAAIDGLFTPDFCGRIGFPSYRLTNNGANIRRLKARQAELTRKAAEPPREDVAGDGFRISEDVEDNRLLIKFDRIPPAELRTKLKAHGFKWSPTRGAWCRQLNGNARYAARAALGLPQ